MTKEKETDRDFRAAVERGEVETEVMLKNHSDRATAVMITERPPIRPHHRRANRRQRK